jgi:hypothetical protein
MVISGTRRQLGHAARGFVHGFDALNDRKP